MELSPALALFSLLLVGPLGLGYFLLLWLNGDFNKFRDEFALLGKHLGHSHLSFQVAERRSNQLGQRLAALDGEPQALSEPPHAPSWGERMGPGQLTWEGWACRRTTISGAPGRSPGEHWFFP